MKKDLLIVIAGKPNVGKSTLFNRLSISKKVITHNEPGVTRDHIIAKAKLGPLYFRICDSPGIELSSKDHFISNITCQSLEALKKSDIVLFVVDGVAGITTEDLSIAQILRESNKKILVVINKSENLNRVNIDKDFYSLGFKDMIMISAAHGQGMMDLCDYLLKIDSIQDIYTKTVRKLKILLLGKPNIGKSSFINSLISEERLLVDNKPGSTRDAIEIDWEYKGHPIEIIDSAGLRKKNNITNKVEQDSSFESVRQIKFCDAVILMLDSTAHLSKQDLRITNIAIKEGRIIVIAINKWDLVRKSDKKELKQYFLENIQRCLPQISQVALVYVSAKTGYNIHKVIDEILTIKEIWSAKFTTGQLNKFLSNALSYHPLPTMPGNKKIKLKYCTQIKNSPPAIRIFCNYPEAIPESYKSYLRNYFREFFKVPACPIRIYFVKSQNPYAT